MHQFHTSGTRLRFRWVVWKSGFFLYILLASCRAKLSRFLYSWPVMEIVTNLWLPWVYYITVEPSNMPWVTCRSSKDESRLINFLSLARPSRWLAHLVLPPVKFLRGDARSSDYNPKPSRGSVGIFSDPHHGVRLLISSPTRSVEVGHHRCRTRK